MKIHISFMLLIAGKHDTNIGLSGSRSIKKNKITGKKPVAQTQLLI